jgi:hypothetical protein
MLNFAMNFASLKNICKISTTYQAFCNLFSTAQNGAMLVVSVGIVVGGWCKGRDDGPILI